MAGRYHYGWDAVNKKKVYLGKYPEANPRGQGYFGNNEAGNKRYEGGGGKPTKREFIGSGITEYTFENTWHGTHTIPAHNFTEALRIAESMGYTRGDYKRRRGKK